MIYQAFIKIKQEIPAPRGSTENVFSKQNMYFLF
jgi:hypothetical protein